MDRPNRIANFLLLCSLVATICVVVVVSQRLSDDALSLTLGIAIGIVALLIPLIAVAAIAYLAVRWTEARPHPRPNPIAAPQPQILVLPQQNALPTIQYAAPTVPYASVGPERHFAVIGDEP